MVTKRQREKQPFDVDAFEREANATLAGMTDAEVEAMHARIASGTTRRQLEEADEIARNFFEEMKNGGELSRSTRARRRASTK